MRRALLSVRPTTQLPPRCYCLLLRYECGQLLENSLLRDQSPQIESLLTKFFELPQKQTTATEGSGLMLYNLILLFTSFFAAALLSQRLFYTLFLAGFQVVGVPFDLLDDVFLLHLALKAPEGIFQILPLLQSNFGQRKTPPNRSLLDRSRLPYSQ
jgi:hypothetical protein